MMKITAVSDLHGNLIKIEPCDVLCICGDIMPLSIQSDMIASIFWIRIYLMPWLQNIPCEKIIMIGGNHDFIFDDSDPQDFFKTYTCDYSKPWSKLTFLQDTETIYNGVRFYGTPWISNLKNWAYYANHDELIERFNKIPEGVDILLTHQPPDVRNYGMVLQPGIFNYMANYGSKELADAIFEKKPKWNIFGHVHTGCHSVEEIKGTKFINVSILDEKYKISYNPYTFEI